MFTINSDTSIFADNFKRQVACGTNRVYLHAAEPYLKNIFIISREEIFTT